MKPEEFAKQLKFGHPMFNPRDPMVIEAHKILVREKLNNIESYDHNSYGKGIIICGGGLKYFPSAWVNASFLRKNGCSLPIQLWHFSGEVNEEMVSAMSTLGVTCVDATKIASGLKNHPRILRGYELKPFSLLHTCFEEVILLDADNLSVVNPEFLFETNEYKETGAIFWPDYWTFGPHDPCWNIMELEYEQWRQIESGQIVLSRKKCWEALCLTQHYNEHSDFYYHYMLGDKDTYNFAWRKLNKKYSMPSRLPYHLNGCALLHYDFGDKIIFEHRIADKWLYDGTNKRTNEFIDEELAIESLSKLRNLWDGKLS